MDGHLLMVQLQPFKTFGTRWMWVVDTSPWLS